MRLFINAKPWAKMVHWTNAAKGEVSALGIVKMLDPETFVVKDIFLFKQTCTVGYTEFDEEAISNFLYDLAVKGKNPQEYNFMFHTHAHGQVFWSIIDTDNIERHSSGSDAYMFSVVMNKGLEWKARIDVKGKRIHEFNPGEVIVLPTGNNKLWGKCNRQVSRLVTHEVPEVVDDVDDALQNFALIPGSDDKAEVRHIGEKVREIHTKERVEELKFAEPRPDIISIDDFLKR